MKTTKEYMESVHRIGKWSSIGSIFVLLLIPTVIAIKFDAFPGIIPILTASAGLLAIFTPVTLAELISYTPVLGSSVYLAYITGNVGNLKLPVALNAIQLLEAESGTEKGDVIASIAVSISSIITIIMLALGVILLVPLKPLLTSPSVQTASSYILPSLFGAFGLSLISRDIGGGIKAKGRLKGAILPTIIICVLFFISRTYVSQLQGVLILLLLPVTYFCTKRLYKKGHITVTNDNIACETEESESKY